MDLSVTCFYGTSRVHNSAGMCVGDGIERERNKYIGTSSGQKEGESEKGQSQW